MAAFVLPKEYIPQNAAAPPALVGRGNPSITGLAAKLWSVLLWYGTSIVFLMVFFVCVCGCVCVSKLLFENQTMI